MKFILLLSVLISFLLYSIKSVMIVLEPVKKKFCAKKHFSDNSIIKLIYVVSGENENIVKASIYNENGSEVFTKDKENTSQFQLEVKNAEYYKVCFSIEVDAECIVSFDFVNVLEVNVFQKLAKDDVFTKLNQNVTTINQMFSDLDHTLKYMAERSDSHNKCNIIYS